MIVFYYTDGEPIRSSVQELGLGIRRGVLVADPFSQVTIPKDLKECNIQNELQYSKFIEKRPSYTEIGLPLKQNWKLYALDSTTFYSAYILMLGPFSHLEIVAL